MRRVLLMALIGALGALIGCFAGYGTARIELNQVTMENHRMVVENHRLQKSHEAMRTENRRLQESHEAMRIDLEELKTCLLWAIARKQHNQEEHGNDTGTGP